MEGRSWVARAHGEFWQARVFGGVRAVSALGGDMVGQEGGGGGLDPHQSHSEAASRHQRGPTPRARNPHPVHHTHMGEEKTPLLYAAGGRRARTEKDSNCQASSQKRKIVDLSARTRVRNGYRQV